MAITRPTRPEFLVGGVVVALAPRRRYDRENSRYTDEVIGHEVTLSQPGSGAQLSVRIPFDRETGHPPVLVPAVLSTFYAVAELSESAEYGVSLAVTRDIVPDDLDRIASALHAPAKG